MLPYIRIWVYTNRLIRQYIHSIINYSSTGGEAGEGGQQGQERQAANMVTSKEIDTIIIYVQHPSTTKSLLLLQFRMEMSTGVV